MTALLVLIPVALVLGLLGLAGFLWSMRTGQFDDLDGAGSRILFDDESRDRHAADPIIQPSGENQWKKHRNSSSES